jgi:hypothetical protein
MQKANNHEQYSEEYILQFQRVSRGRHLNLNADMKGQGQSLGTLYTTDHGTVSVDSMWSTLTAEQKMQLLSRCQDASMYILFPKQSRDII